MAELTPIPSAQRPSEPGYQPVSGYAVAAAVAAGVFVALLLVLLVAAVQSRRTLMSDGVLVLAVAGVILAAIARSHVRNSEGTRTGLRLANSAWWVCVLGGAAFFGYVQANALILERESARFADGFFKELKDGRMTYAFEYMLPPEERGRADPAVPDAFESAYLSNGYPFFKNHELVRVVMRNGQDSQFEHVGVKDLGQESAGFQAIHLYRLTCPEGVFDVQVKLVAAESRTGSKTQVKWRIPADPNPNMSLRPDRVSAFGRLLTDLEREGISYVNLWLLHMSGGRRTIAQLMTMPPAHRRPIEIGLGDASLMGGAPASLFPLRAEFLPADRRPPEAGANVSPTTLSFDDLVRSGFFRTDDAGSPLPEDKLARLRALWAAPRLEPGQAVRQVQMAQVPPAMPITVITPDKITVIVSAELTLETPMLFARVVVGVECADPEVVSALAAARARGAAPDDMAVTLKTLPQRGWKIAWFRTDMEPLAVGSGAPGSMPQMPPTMPGR